MSDTLSPDFSRLVSKDSENLDSQNADGPFQSAWKYAEYYLAQGLSIIPVRDKPQFYKGREYTVKSAYPWAKYQSEIATPIELYDLMTKNDTAGFGIVCGKVSGNLIVIDIDTKNWPEIAVLLLNAIKDFFPQLFERLRIIQTPSGGCHLYFRIKDREPDGNKKLAFKDGQKEAAIETRGEGGYVCASPAMRYNVVKDNPIPVVTWIEWCGLVALCEGFNERKKVEKIATPSGLGDMYVENPFESFNNSPAAENVLTDNGWTVCGSNNSFIWFTRPGKQSGISASFNREKRCYFIFTSSTEFEPSKGYHPATALSILQFNGDKKATYKYLVDSSYGKLKPAREKQIAINAARRGNSLPANLSPEAREMSTTLKSELEAMHPHGVFWEYDMEKISINRERLILVANQLGLRYHKGDVVQIKGHFIHKIEVRDFQDRIKNYIKEPDAIEYLKIVNQLEAFLESHGKYTISRLPILETTAVLKDTESTCFKFFINGYLCINAEIISFHSYETLKHLVWHEKVQQRNYYRCNGGAYRDFLQKALVLPESAATIVGFLSHEYKDETTGYIIVLTEKCLDPRQGGGSGKNVFCNLLSYTTTYTSKPGSQAKFDEKFFQSWNRQKIFSISDAPKNFDFSFLKEPATGTFIWKKLFKDEIEVPNEDAPKFIVQTNFSYEVTDGGLRRRIIPLEFSDFFTKAGGVDVHYGKHFPRGWSDEDWGGFDTYIAESVQTWIRANRKLVASSLTESGWEKQFQQTYGHVAHDFIVENFESWKQLEFVSNERWKNALESYYRDNDIGPKFHVASRKLYEAVKVYCDKNEMLFMNDVSGREGYNVLKGKKFTLKV